MAPTDPRRLRLVLGSALLAAWAAVGAGTAVPGLGALRAEEGVACRHWAVLLAEDAGQHRVYDGLRKGLEAAQLERVCLRDAADAPEAFEALVAWHRARPAPAPLLFAIGGRAASRLLDAGFQGPGVVVTTRVEAGGLPLAPPPPLPAGVLGVRAALAAEALGAALRGALSLPPEAQPAVALAAQAAPRLPEEPLARFARAAGLRLVEPGAVPAPRALLHLRLGLGETLLPFEQARDLARAIPALLVADDPARFGPAGAGLLLVPDARRLGRTAAEAARRLARGEVPGGEELPVRTLEVWFDLDAARGQGVDPPLAFLAGVDVLRARRAGSTGSAR